MAKLAICISNGNTIVAPFEAWLVAMLNSLTPLQQQLVYTQIQTLEEASLIPDKFKIGEDALGTITVVENPIVDLTKRF